MKIHIIKKGKKTYCGRTSKNSAGTGHFGVIYPAQLSVKKAVYIGLCGQCAKNFGMEKC